MLNCTLFLTHLACILINSNLSVRMEKKSLKWLILVSFAFGIKNSSLFFLLLFCFFTLFYHSLLKKYQILLSLKREQNWVICRDVDGPRVCHAQWSESEREKQISYIHACMWNLEKWFRWTQLQGSSSDADVENRCVAPGGGVRGGWYELGDWVWHKYIPTCKIDRSWEPAV